MWGCFHYVFHHNNSTTSFASSNAYQNSKANKHKYITKIFVPPGQHMRNIPSHIGHTLTSSIKYILSTISKLQKIETNVKHNI